MPRSRPRKATLEEKKMIIEPVMEAFKRAIEKTEEDYRRAGCAVKFGKPRVVFVPSQVSKAPPKKKPPEKSSKKKPR